MVSEDEVDLACLDHAYFHEELHKLTRLIFDVKRERFEIRGAKGTDHEWQTMEQIEIQLDNLWIMNDEMVQFDIKERLNELYNMAETLFKIKTGKLDDAIIPVIEDQNYEYTDFDQYNQEYYDEDPEDFEYEECGYLEDELVYSKKPKAYRMKNKRK